MNIKLSARAIVSNVSPLKIIRDIIDIVEFSFSLIKENQDKESSKRS